MCATACFFERLSTRAVMIPGLELAPESDFGSFWTSDSGSGSFSLESLSILLWSNLPWELIPSLEPIPTLDPIPLLEPIPPWNRPRLICPSSDSDSGSGN